MLESGFIKLHRNILKWCWYGDLTTRSLFIHLLLTVNYEDKRWQDITVRRGSRIASYEKLAAETGLTVRQVRTAISHLESTGEVTRSAHPKYTVFSIKNYGQYQQGDKQNDRQNAKQATRYRQGSDNNGRKYKESNKKDKEIPAPHTPREAAQRHDDKQPVMGEVGYKDF